MSRLTAVGCGPGDPDLLTVKAVNAIKTADVILCPKSKDDRPTLPSSFCKCLARHNRSHAVFSDWYITRFLH